MAGYLEHSEIFQHTVHHVFFWQVFQLVDEVDHVFTHGGAVDTVDEAPIFEPGILCLLGGNKDILNLK